MSATEILRRERQRKEAKQEERERRRGRRLVRPKEAQQRLGVGHTKFYADFVNTGRLRLVELGPRSKAAVEDELDALIDRLDDRTASIIRSRYGMEDGRERTLTEVGKQHGLTRERIRQIEKHALAELRKIADHAGFEAA